MLLARGELTLRNVEGVVVDVLGNDTKDPCAFALAVVAVDRCDHRTIAAALIPVGLAVVLDGEHPTLAAGEGDVDHDAPLAVKRTPSSVERTLRLGDAFPAQLRLGLVPGAGEDVLLRGPVLEAEGVDRVGLRVDGEGQILLESLPRGVLAVLGDGDGVAETQHDQRVGTLVHGLEGLDQVVKKPLVPLEADELRRAHQDGERLLLTHTEVVPHDDDVLRWVELNGRQHGHALEVGRGHVDLHPVALLGRIDRQASDLIDHLALEDRGEVGRLRLLGHKDVLLHVVTPSGSGGVIRRVFFWERATDRVSTRSQGRMVRENKFNVKPPALWIQKTSLYNEVFLWRRGRESNPRIRVLQTPALPLGYHALLFSGGCDRNNDYTKREAA